jgi:hypothetical protein
MKIFLFDGGKSLTSLRIQESNETSYHQTAVPVLEKRASVPLYTGTCHYRIKTPLHQSIA